MSKFYRGRFFSMCLLRRCRELYPVFLWPSVRKLPCVSYPDVVATLSRQGLLRRGFSLSLTWVLECFHMRADKKLQWWIAIAIFELPSVHTREKTSQSLRFSIPEQGEEVWLVSVFFWHANCYFIWDRISIRKCVVSWLKWLGQVALPPKSQFRGIHTAILMCD